MNDLNCPITHDLMVDPITVPCCGRSFSRQSLVDAFQYQGTQCPACRESINDFNPETAPKNVALAYMIEAQGGDTTQVDKLKCTSLSRTLDKIPLSGNLFHL